MSWNHILNTPNPLDSRTTHKPESDYFPKSIGKCSLKGEHEEKETSDFFPLDM